MPSREGVARPIQCAAGTSTFAKQIYRAPQVHIAFIYRVRSTYRVTIGDITCFPMASI